MEGNEKTTQNSETEENINNIKELNEEENESSELDRLNEEFYEKKCCYKEGFIGYIQEMIVIAFINVSWISILLFLNKVVLFKNNNYINLVKKSSNSLTNFEKFWCYSGNNEFIILIIYLVFLLIFIFFFILILVYSCKNRISLDNETIINNKNKVIIIYFPLYIVFNIFFSLINYLIIYSIIFISISPIEYPGVFKLADKSRALTLDEEIEIENAVDKFKKSKFFHILYIIISFIILYLNILIIKLIYKSIIFVLEKDEENKKGDKKGDKKEEIKKDVKEDEKEGQNDEETKNSTENSKKDEKTKIEVDKNKQQVIKNLEQKEYNWKYPDINNEFTLLESFYLGIFLILHLSISLFKLNIYEEENYQELLFSVEENKMKKPKNYSILGVYGCFEISINSSFFVLNLIYFAIIIFLMFRKMLYDNVPKYLKLLVPKIILLMLNFMHSIFAILLIIFSGLCLSSLNALDENKNINYFVVKKKLIGQIIVNLFILVFLILIIIDYFRFVFYCCEKKNDKRDNRVKSKKDKIDKSLSQSESKGSSSRRVMYNNYLITE